MEQFTIDYFFGDDTKNQNPQNISDETLLKDMIYNFGSNFPSTTKFSSYVQTIVTPLTDAIKNPDETLFKLYSMESRMYKLFDEYNGDIRFNTCINSDGTLNTRKIRKIAMSIFNRGKCRAGASTEYHIKSILDKNGILYSYQQCTESGKPDFILPSIQAYYDENYLPEDIIHLAVEHSCVDRWRKTVSEAKRLNTVYLCTIDTKLSEHKINDMKQHNVHLVIPEHYRKKYPVKIQDDILTFKDFIDLAKINQYNYDPYKYKTGYNDYVESANSAFENVFEKYLS